MLFCCLLKTQLFLTFHFPRRHDGNTTLGISTLSWVATSTLFMVRVIWWGGKRKCIALGLSSHKHNPFRHSPTSLSGVPSTLVQAFLSESHQWQNSPSGFLTLSPVANLVYVSWYKYAWLRYCCNTKSRTYGIFTHFLLWLCNQTLVGFLGFFFFFFNLTVVSCFILF